MKLTDPSGHKIIQLENDEVLEITLEDFSEGSRDFQLTVELLSENAECHIKGRAQCFGSDKKNWQVKQVFRGHNQTGSIDLRGTAEDQSFLGFDGNGTLKEGSSEADANITEKIILFDQAKGRSLPVLRVETDKVKSAGHGASIAPVDNEKILYFQARGVSRKEAEKLIKIGFLK
jgi:Fe-S cluster assembly protein SufD